MPCLKSLKEGNVGAVVAQEMLTHGEIVVNFADVSMTLSEAGIQRILGNSLSTLVSFCHVCLLLQSH